MNFRHLQKILKALNPLPFSAILRNVITILRYYILTIGYVIVNSPGMSFNKARVGSASEGMETGWEGVLGSLVSTDNACLSVVMSLENPVFCRKRRDN